MLKNDLILKNKGFLKLKQKWKRKAQKTTLGNLKLPH
jgi:hypothetical protein